MVYLAVWLQLHRRHLGCHSRDLSTQSGTDRCKTLPAASTIPRSYMGKNHTSVRDSKKAQKHKLSIVIS